VGRRITTVNVLVAKVHELSVAGRFPESNESACTQKIAEQLRADGEMLARLELRHFGEVERQSSQFREPRYISVLDAIDKIMVC
jgi:hypothetical protein